jgi:hypothetical protein
MLSELEAKLETKYQKERQRRKEAEKIAVEYRMRLEALEDSIEAGNFEHGAMALGSLTQSEDRAELEAMY